MSDAAFTAAREITWAGSPRGASTRTRAGRARERALAAGRSGGRRAVGRPNAEDYKLAQAEWDAFAR